ncbi:MAG: hypothetical protein K6E74_04400 [Bacilli bacterium]|nr:hypothetical protein [Bacilli bacterium]
MRKVKKLVILVLLVISIFYLGVYKVKATKYNSNKVYTYYTDVSRPDTLLEIIDAIGLTAEIGGVDISNSIVYVDSAEYINEVLNKPRASMRTLGTYTVSFEAFAPNGNSAVCSINIVVEDKDEPCKMELYTKDELSISISEMDQFGDSFVADRILKNIRYIDDHDLFNVEYFVDDSNILKKAGDYTVTTTIKDQSDNEAFHTMTIHIIDEILPRFEIENEYFLAKPSDGYTIDNIVARAHVLAFGNDGTELDVSVKSDNLPNAFTTPGIYIVPVEASYNGHTSSINIYLEIFDETVPEFSLNESVLTVTNKVMCPKDEIDAFINLRAKSTNYTYEVINDCYSENYDQNGDYDYDVLLTYEDGHEEMLHLTLRVIEDEEIKEVEEETKNPNFFQKVWNFSKHFVIVLWKIIIWPIRLLKTSK